MTQANEISKQFNSFEINYDNALEFILNNNEPYAHLLKKYIFSQLEIKYHIYGMAEALDFEGESTEILNQILNGNNPHLWEKIMEYDKSENYKFIEGNELYYQIDQKAKLIMATEYTLPEKLKQAEEELLANPKFKIFKKRKLEQNIEQIKQQILNNKEKILEYSPLPTQPTNDFNSIKEKEWQEFYNRHFKHQNFKDSSELANYLKAKSSLPHSIQNLKSDIILNYQLTNYIFNNVDNTKSLDEILFGIRETFSKFAISGLIEVSIDTNYIKNDFPISSLQSDFMKKRTQGSQVRAEMDKLNLEFEQLKTITNNEEYIKKALDIFQRFVQIHPYGDGNGRTSRYLLNYMLVAKNIVPPVLYDTYMDRRKLDQLSNEFVLNGNKQPLYDYVTGLVKEQLANPNPTDNQPTINISESITRK